MNSEKSKEFVAGLRSVLPLMIGGIPFGVICGVIAHESGIPTHIAQAMSSVVFAGSAQFIAAQMISTSVPALVIISTIAIVNLRHALYSASIAPYIKHLSKYWKIILAYLLTDEAYAVAIIHYNDGKVNKYKHWFFLGAGLILWCCWQISTAIGIILGSVIPSEWQLDFTLALTFIALVVPALKDKAVITAALIAGCVAILGYNLPYKLGIIVAALVGIFAGVIMEERN